MKAKRLTLLISIITLLFLSGCVVGRRTIDLQVPNTQSSNSKDASVSVIRVEDMRVFMNQPAQPSIPSIDGDVNSMSKEQLAGMIGRQRNGFGKAMGDIGLPADVTIQDKAKSLIEEGLRKKGYAVGNNPNSDYKAEVNVEEFWAWFTPGMWSISFEARIKCLVTIKGETKVAELVVEGYGLNNGQVASDPNWQLAYTRAFDNFLFNFEQELDAKGF